MTNTYTALIRTFNSMPMLNDVIDLLLKQSIPPSAIILVDSSTDASQKDSILSLGYPVIRYPEGEAFNFSKAINIGVDAVATDLVLIISSHVLLSDAQLIERAFTLENFKQSKYLGFCLIPWSDPNVRWKPTRVDKQNFSIDLCASNSCTLLKVENIKERYFREDVFSAEDQEWVAYFLRAHDAYFYNVISHDVKYMNTHFNTQKLINELVALAYFTFPEMLSLKYISSRLCRSVLAALRMRGERAKLHFVVAKELFTARYRKPTKKSKYF